MKIKVPADGFDPYEAEVEDRPSGVSVDWRSKRISHYTDMAGTSLARYRRVYGMELDYELKLDDEIAPDFFAEHTGVPPQFVGAVCAEMVKRGWLSERTPVTESVYHASHGVCLHLLRGLWYRKEPPDRHRRSRSRRGYKVIRRTDQELERDIRAFIRTNPPVQWSGLVHKVTMTKEAAEALVRKPADKRRRGDEDGEPKRRCPTCGTAMRKKWTKHPREQCRLAVVAGILDS